LVSRSNPSWVLWKISSVSRSFHLSILSPVNPIRDWTD
jgi:hypothetical protein